MISPKIKGLAILGSAPAFQKTIPVGQLNFPEWGRFEAMFRGIFSRQYYTNQGPLADELEAKLRVFFGVKHVVCMTNATIALMIAAKALDLKGKVICTAFTFVATAQSVSWAGLEPVFCDVDPTTHQMSVENVAALIDDDVSAILGVHLWGNPCNPEALQEVGELLGVAILDHPVGEGHRPPGRRVVLGASPVGVDLEAAPVKQIHVQVALGPPDLETRLHAALKHRSRSL